MYYAKKRHFLWKGSARSLNNQLRRLASLRRKNHCFRVLYLYLYWQENTAENFAMCTSVVESTGKSFCWEEQKLKQEEPLTRDQGHILLGVRHFVILFQWYLYFYKCICIKQNQGIQGF